MTLLCVPDLPSFSLLNIPLLEQYRQYRRMLAIAHKRPGMTLKALNETQREAVIAATCNPQRLSEFCSIWDGIQLCVMPGSLRLLHTSPITTLPRFQRKLRVFSLRAACSSTAASAYELPASNRSWTENHSIASASKYGHAVCEVTSSDAESDRKTTFPVSPCGCGERNDIQVEAHGSVATHSFERRLNPQGGKIGGSSRPCSPSALH